MGYHFYGWVRIGGGPFWVDGGEWTFFIGGRGLMEVGGGIF